MSKVVGYCALLVMGLFLAAIAVCEPQFISDDNKFLVNFVNHEILAVVGMMLTITLASAGQIHLSLNEIEGKVGRTVFLKTRANLHNSAYCLIALFLIMIVVVVVKPIVCEAPRSAALFTGAALYIMFWMALIMTSIVRFVFAIKPRFDTD